MKGISYCFDIWKARWKWRETRKRQIGIGGRERVVFFGVCAEISCVSFSSFLFFLLARVPFFFRTWRPGEFCMHILTDVYVWTGGLNASTRKPRPSWSAIGCVRAIRSDGRLSLSLSSIYLHFPFCFNTLSVSLFSFFSFFPVSFCFYIPNVKRTLLVSLLLLWVPERERVRAAKEKK